MGFLVGLVLLVVGVGFLVQACRADHAVRRWPRTTGTIRQATKRHLTDDGRRWWAVLVTYRTDTGEDVESWGKQISGDADTLTGRTVDVWYDPRKPERSHTALEGLSPGSSWFQYVLGLVFAVAGAAVLVRAVR